MLISFSPIAPFFQVLHGGIACMAITPFLLIASNVTLIQACIKKWFRVFKECMVEMNQTLNCSQYCSDSLQHWSKHSPVDNQSHPIIPSTTNKRGLYKERDQHTAYIKVCFVHSLIHIRTLVKPRFKGLTSKKKRKEKKKHIWEGSVKWQAPRQQKFPTSCILDVAGYLWGDGLNINYI